MTRKRDRLLLVSITAILIAVLLAPFYPVAATLLIVTFCLVAAVYAWKD